MKTDILVKQTYNKVAGEYHQQWGHYSKFFLKYSEIFISKLSDNSKILDLGCGTGRDSKRFFEKGFKVTGVDFSKSMLKIAHKNVPEVEFIQKDMREINFPDYSFDGIWCSFSLLHLKRKDVGPFLKRINKFLKNNGVLFIATKEGQGEIIEPEHLNENLKMFETFFQKSELENLIKKAGYKILKSELATDRKESDEKIIIILTKKRK